MICFPNAKINIGLLVRSRREDGYHNIETIMYPVGLSDILEVAKINTGKTIINNTGLNVRTPIKNNLVYKAYRILKEKFDLPDITMHLHKIIPFGAGLGGGSSDAAFAFKSILALFQLHLEKQEIHEMVSSIGSDCTFFLENKPSLVKGVGDIIEPIQLDLSGYKLVIIYPKIHISTPQAYAGIEVFSSSHALDDLIKLPIKEWKDNIFNDFEHSVFRKYTELEDIKNLLYEKGAAYASMSGSGSAIYGLFNQDNIDFSELPSSYFIWIEK